MLRKLLASVLIASSTLTFGGVATAAAKPPLHVYCKLYAFNRTATNPTILLGNGYCYLPILDDKIAELHIVFFSGKWFTSPNDLPGTNGMKFTFSGPKVGTFQLALVPVPNMPSAAVQVHWAIVPTQIGGPSLAGGRFTFPALNLLVTSPITATGTAFHKFHFALSAKMGAAPYTWSQIAGKMPPGLKLSPNGVISGLPSLPGSYQVTLRVSTKHHKSSTSFPETITSIYLAHSARVERSR
jgi:hypothetical protein